MVTNVSDFKDFYKKGRPKVFSWKYILYNIGIKPTRGWFSRQELEQSPDPTWLSWSWWVFLVIFLWESEHLELSHIQKMAGKCLPEDLKQSKPASSVIQVNFFLMTNFLSSCVICLFVYALCALEMLILLFHRKLFVRQFKLLYSKAEMK